MTYRIIGLMGKARSGKDTVGNMLLEQHYGGSRMAFADKLKQVCGELYGLTDEQLYTEAGKAQATDLRCLTCPLCGGTNAHEVKLERETKAECLNPGCKAIGEVASFKGFWTTRMILQFVGTECFRRVDPMVWTRYLVRAAKAQLDAKTTKFVVVTDCRFRNEKAAIEVAGGEVWRIKRPEVDKASAGIIGHASEMEMDSIPDSEFGRVIVNDGTLADLREKTSIAMSQSASAHARS